MKYIKKALLFIWSSILFCMLYIFRIWSFKDGFTINGVTYPHNKKERILWIIPKWWAFNWPSTVCGEVDVAIVDPIKRCVMVYPPNKKVPERLDLHEANHLHYVKKWGALKFIYRYLLWTILYGYRNNPIEVCARLVSLKMDAAIYGKNVNTWCVCKLTFHIKTPKTKQNMCIRCGKKIVY